MTHVERGTCFQWTLPLFSRVSSLFTILPNPAKLTPAFHLTLVAIREHVQLSWALTNLLVMESKYPARPCSSLA